MKSRGHKSPVSRKPAALRQPRRRSLPVGLGCPIVGIGASAGGLEAFTQLLRQLPVDTGFGFVLVQHLDPQHESALAQLLARATAMPVCEATHNLRVRANHVYIIPPNTSLGIARGVLSLQPRLKNRVAFRSVDFFLEALAKDRRERAIGVILSGTATDGTLGLEAIKAEGGLTFAQDDSARYDSMPQSAVRAGCVDFVLSPANIARELARIAKHPYVAGQRPGSREPKPGKRRPEAPAAEIKGQRPTLLAAGAPTDSRGAEAERGYQKILLLLRNHSGVDFSLYKSATIGRRIARRTLLNRRPSLENYAEFLRGNAKELDALYSDLLISVTSFFRNEEAFEILQRKVFSKLLQRGGQQPVRIWILGCSTGQEAYSIAMAYAECAAKVARPRKLQVFATDLNEANLEKARHGFYAKSLVEDVSPQRLRRFFVEEDSGYRVVKSLREVVVFARQNIISDPPFSRMDLICCRNLMIYLQPGLQKRVIPTFHYALNPGGYLFLGVSESLSGFAHLFVPVDKRQKIFAKKAASTSTFHLPVRLKEGERVPAGKTARPSAAAAKKPGILAEAIRRELGAEREADRVTVNHFAPPGVLVDADLQIVQFRGSTSSYLEPASGKATFDLLKMAREGLMLPLRAAIHRAQKEHKAVRSENVPVTQDGETRLVNIEVIPLKNLQERCLLVLFENAARERDPAGAPPPRESAAGGAQARHRAVRMQESGRVAGLERDLVEARDYLQFVQEYQETTTEELQAANEEGQSANEELQSLNEELETSKEELQSTNEELTTVNEEMINRNAELNRLNGELAATREHAEAVIRTVAVPLMVLAADLRVLSVNEAFSLTFQMGAGDLTGRAIFEAEQGPWNIPGLRPLLEDVIQRNGTFEEFAVERHFKKIGHRSLLLNGRLLNEAGGKAREILLVIQDITERKQGEEALHQARTELAQHAVRLERQVAIRTAELTAANRQLEGSIDSIQKGKDEYRDLLAQSQVLQKQLRHLTRNILTAQEEERKEISRELHDEVVQTLIGINVELSGLAKLGTVGNEVLKEKIGRTQRLVEGSVDAVHRFARGLRPAVLDDLGLIPALHAYSRGLAAKKQIKIHFTAFSGVESLGDAERTVLFRVAQEALNNVARHAEATEVKMTISAVGQAIRMEICDNGKSFPVGKILLKSGTRRLGLVGMNERMQMVGGSLMIESAPGRGTTVRAEIPFKPEKQKP